MPADAFNRPTRWLLRLWIPVALLLAWELAVRASLLDPLFFPAPTKLAASALEMTRRGELGTQIRATLLRSATGFLAGAWSLLGIKIRRNHDVNIYSV